MSCFDVLGNLAHDNSIDWNEWFRIFKSKRLPKLDSGSGWFWNHFNFMVDLKHSNMLGISYGIPYSMVLSLIVCVERFSKNQLLNNRIYTDGQIVINAEN